jgi:hypothetical protein
MMLMPKSFSSKTSIMYGQTDFKPHEAQYKKLLAGVLVRLRQRAFGYLEKLEKGNCSTEELRNV